MSAQHPLGAVIGARSGDKGGNANIGVWVPDPVERAAVRLTGQVDPPVPDEAAVTLADQRYAWLCSYLTVDRLRLLLPEVSRLRIDRVELPNLRALNFVVYGLLGRGVADSTRSDPQAKGLAEHLRARQVPIPDALEPGADITRTP